MIFLTETKCKIRFIYVGFNCKRKKWGKKMSGNLWPKLVEIVTVADVDDEDLVGNSLLQIWELRFGHKAKRLFRL